MENTLYVALSRQIVTQRNMDVIANNLANMNSPGYKREQVMFGEYVKNVGRKESLSFVEDIALGRNLGAGQYVKTTNDFDVAIKGRGWLEIATRNGSRYTRNGHFEMDQLGRMVTADGAPVESERGGPIQFKAGDSQIVIKDDGTVTANGQARGKIKLVDFADQSKLQKAAGNLYRAETPSRPATDATFVQGMLEKSNVQPIVEIANMITALRGYQGTQKLIDQEHERQRSAVEKLTREA